MILLDFVSDIVEYSGQTMILQKYSTGNPVRQRVGSWGTRSQGGSVRNLSRAQAIGKLVETTKPRILSFKDWIYWISMMFMVNMTIQIAKMI